MSDDVSRSTSGNPPDQRRGRGAPAWWTALERDDLPDDGARPAAATASAPAPPPPVAARTPATVRQALPGAKRGMSSAQRLIILQQRKRTLLASLFVIMLAGLVAAVGVGATSMRDAVAAIIVFGVPSLLATIVAVVALRLGR